MRRLCWKIGRSGALLAAALLVADVASAQELQGHRGARGLAPENTLPGFEAALAYRVDVLELDVGVTADGAVVVHHDRRLSPDLARDGGGDWIATPGPLLSTLTLAEVQGYDVGRARPDSRSARRFPEQRAIDGTPIPTLGQVLALGGRADQAALRFNIETKLSPAHPGDTVEPERFARRLLEVVGAAGMLERVTIQSFDWRTLKATRQLAPEVPTVCLTAERNWLNNVQIGQPGASPWLAGLDVDDHGGSVAKLVRAAGCAVWSPYHRDLDASRLAEAHRLGLAVVVWTVNDPAEMRALAALGVDGIITDYPDRAVEALGRPRD